MKNLILFILIISGKILGFSQSADLEEYSKIRKLNNAEAYTDFIRKYPSSVYIQEAKKARTALDSIVIINKTFLGNEKHNYYGNVAPDKLDTLWKIYLGESISPAYGKQQVWKGAGWTGQPLMVKEGKEAYLIQGAFDQNLKKIKARTGEIVWQCKFDDILKATGTIWVNHNAENKEDRYVIIQGSRLGVGNSKQSKYCTSLRAVSYITGKELWRLNSKTTDSYSRDCDASCIVVNDTAYIGLENGLFLTFDPDYKHVRMLDGMLQPGIYKEIKNYTATDIRLHGQELCMESSPALINRHIYTPSGSGWVYGYNMDTKINDWEFYIGSDMDGSAPVTAENNLIIVIEKQFIEGRGGVMKIDPSKPPKDAVVWYYPTENKKWYFWDGGLINSVAINDAYINKGDLHLAVFIDVSGHITIVDHQSIDPTKKEPGPDNKTLYPLPKVLVHQEIPGTIATPLIVGDKIVAPTDEGLFLYQLIIDKDGAKLKLLDKTSKIDFDATPFVWDGKIYVAGMNGYLYCFGENWK